MAQGYHELVKHNDNYYMCLKCRLQIPTSNVRQAQITPGCLGK